MKLKSLTLILLGLLLSITISGQNTRRLERETSKSNTEKRTALVIGNADYVSARKLANPANDASDMARSLGELGFEVISGTNLNLRQMNDKVREFGDRLKANGGVGLFYYAGHGIQVGGRNYLIPVEADIPREDEVDFNALNLDLVLRKMATASNGLNIVILDACRNNPFARSWSRSTDDAGGLAQISAPTGTFIAYATSPDRTASDGAGRNGLYTAELLKFIKQPNMKIEEAFKQVTIAVDRASGGKQVPWTSSSLRGEFYFKAEKTGAAVTNQTETIGNSKDKVTQEREGWNLVKNSSDAEDLRLFLKEFPGGANAESAKTRLEELVWSAAKNSNDKAKVQAYLNEFPNGANSSLARILLRQLNSVSPVPVNQLAKIVLVNTWAFDDGKTGITQYANALNKLEAEFAPASAELQKIAKQIETLESELKNTSLSEQVRQQKIKDHERLKKEYDQKLNDAKNSYEQRRSIVIKPIFDEIGAFWGKWEKQIDYRILDGAELNDVLLAFDNNLDVTKRFITDYNNRQTNNSVSGQEINISSIKIGLLNTTFFDKVNGIKQFDMKNEQLVQRIVKSIESFRKDYGYGMILDSGKAIPSTLDNLPKTDITREFIDYFNRSNP